jgi:hypothetical protein
VNTSGGRKPSNAAKRVLRARTLRVIGVSGADRPPATIILKEIDHENADDLSASMASALIDRASVDRDMIARGVSALRCGSTSNTMRGPLFCGDGELRVKLIDGDDDRLERRYTEIQRPTPWPAIVRKWTAFATSAKCSLPRAIAHIC